jgi:hypothetical protein
MADGLPYFKFEVSKWISGKITLEKMDVQGLFINISALYWQRSGNLTLTETKRRLTNVKPKAFDSLIESGLIKLNGDNLTIEYLDEQLNERKHKHEINKANGLLGGRPKKPKAFDSLTEQKGIRKEENRKEESDIREYGPKSQAFVIVLPKYLNQPKAKIYSKVGLIEYMEANQTILNNSQLGDKFMLINAGKIYNDLGHLQNSYNRFVKEEYK